jgi:sterol desaturase/sphingolipid hydroxylase (fatty acid hydroxylase superfamily)
MALGAFAVGFVYTAALHALWDVVATFRPSALAAFWRGHSVAGAAAAFVAWDAAGWLYHLVGHRTRLGWAAHQPHHSGEEFDATLGLRQSWTPFHGLAHQPVLALAGFDFRVIAVCAAVSNAWQVLEHTSVPVRFPHWFEANVFTPATHRHHHGRDGGAVNLGPFFTWWDRLAGTWVGPEAPAPIAYGPATAASTNPVAVELAGWRDLAASVTYGLASRARRKITTCQAMTAGMTSAKGLSDRVRIEATDPSADSPSTDRHATHHAIAMLEPRAARGASTKPPTIEPIETTATNRSRKRARASRRPSMDTVSASTARPASRVSPSGSSRIS